MDYTKLKDALEKLGFVHRPDLAGRPDFAHFDKRVAVFLMSKAEQEKRNQLKKEWIDHKRDLSQVGRECKRLVKYFRTMHRKHWRVIWVPEKEKIGRVLAVVTKVLEFQTNRMTELEFSRYRLPPGPQPTSQKLIELLRQTHAEILSEEAKRKRNWHMIRGLENRRKNIEKALFPIFRPKILKRDGRKCLACGSAAKLDLAHVYMGGQLEFTSANPRWLRKNPKGTTPYVSPEVRWEENNMLTLCRSCHIIFDSTVRLPGKVNIDKAVRFIQKVREELELKPGERAGRFTMAV